MPNPKAFALPNTQSYDTTSPDVVIDNITSLMWQRRRAPAELDWFTARAYCDGLDLAGHADWRLPSRIEAVSLNDFTIAPAPINAAAFPDATSTTNLFWSSSTSRSGSGGVSWFVNFGYYAGEGLFSSTSALGIRCVRGSSSAPTTHYTIQNGLVRDNGTGLTWQQDPAPGTYTAPEATEYCRTLAPDGGAPFRLPSLNEIETLVDESTSDPAIDAAAFPATPSEYFWTSSAYPGTTGIFVVDFSDGESNPFRDATRNNYRARCVR